MLYSRYLVHPGTLLLVPLLVSLVIQHGILHLPCLASGWQHHPGKCSAGDPKTSAADACSVGPRVLGSCHDETTSIQKHANNEVNNNNKS